MEHANLWRSYLLHSIIETSEAAGFYQLLRGNPHLRRNIAAYLLRWHSAGFVTHGEDDPRYSQVQGLQSALVSDRGSMIGPPEHNSSRRDHEIFIFSYLPIFHFPDGYFIVSFFKIGLFSPTTASFARCLIFVVARLHVNSPRQ